MLLYEYSKTHEINNLDALDKQLQAIWQRRKPQIEDEELSEEAISDGNSYQPFLSFSRDGIQARNYVGFIQHGDTLIEIYPKVFRNSTNDKKDMLRHIFFWLSHCQKWRFPFCRANLDLSDIDTFPELIINLIARQFFDAVSGQPLMIYQPTEEAMLTPKGTINFNRYITNSISKGNFQNIECDYEPFLFDNKVNRIIKYCARLLMRQAKFSETQRILQEIIFILDEVEDIHCSSADIVNIKLNSFFDEYNLILESCKLILDQQIYSNNSSDLSQWCLLFPMEYIFEDFISGFISQHFSNKWTVKSQKSEMYLSDDPKAFKMRHDIFLTNGERKIIVDTKYKLRTFEKDDKKKGIAQSDMYQMVSYAFRRGCNDVLLLYPNIDEQISKPDLFEIGSGFVGKDKITVTAMNIPFWMEGALDCEKLTTKLRNRLEELLN